MEKKLIECVPNFSEGRDESIIKEITNAVESVEGVILMNVDPGYATNRTVVTFVGEPKQVIEAAFRAIKTAATLIDMRHHHGEHPRIGATDVCPLVPVSGVTMEDCVSYARTLSKRVGSELGIPVYCYENAAFSPERRNLATCRSGEYEGLAEKINTEKWRPDFGPSEFNENVAKSGLSVIGARDFLVAINFNLNTTSTRRAFAVANDVREKGRKKREGGSLTGPVCLDENGHEIWQKGTLKSCKAIGWFIEEYGIAQVSMNITDINVTPVHIAFDEVTRAANNRGLRVTGSEIIGLIPKRVLIDAGKYYLKKQHRSVGISESEIIKIAVKSMGLDDLCPFEPRKKVIEYILEDRNQTPKLLNLTCRDFAEKTASESPAPGGGSVSAYVASLGASLCAMVANLSSHKRGWDDKWEFFSEYAEKAHELMDELSHLVDEDTIAFNKVLAAFSLPKKNDIEKTNRKKAIQEATLYAIQIPFKTMQTAYKLFEIAEVMIDKGNINSVSDAGVGVLCANTAIKGAYMNVKINSESIKDKNLINSIIVESEYILKRSEDEERRLIHRVLTKM